MSTSALKRALANFDGKQTKLAAALGTSQQLVSYWINKERPLPAEFVLKAEEVTGISRHEWRPDIYPRDEQAAA